MVITGIECGNVMQRLAAGVREDPGIANLDLFECFEAIGGEPWAHDIETSGSASTQAGNRFVGIRAQPLGATEPRLERRNPVILFELQRIGDEPCGLETLAWGRRPLSCE